MEVQRVAISFQKENMVGVNSSNSLVNAAIKRPDLLFAYIAWLVDWIITRYPGVAFIVVGYHFPQMHNAILKVFVLPEQCFMRWVVAVPILILVAWQGM